MVVGQDGGAGHEYLADRLHQVHHHPGFALLELPAHRRELVLEQMGQSVEAVGGPEVRDTPGPRRRHGQHGLARAEGQVEVRAVRWRGGGRGGGQAALPDHPPGLDVVAVLPEEVVAGRAERHPESHFPVPEARATQQRHVPYDTGELPQKVTQLTWKCGSFAMSYMDTCGKFL